VEFVSIATAVTLTGWSERTFWRRLADGSVQRSAESANGRNMVRFDSIKMHLCVPLDADDILLICDADNGSAEAQVDLAILFMSYGKFKQAIAWLELAIKRDHAGAMHWLGRCHVEGNGVPKDENLGLMWIAKAAVQGHVISQGQMQAMREKLTGAT
jgi:TPR repeat protein